MVIKKRGMLFSLPLWLSIGVANSGKIALDKWVMVLVYGRAQDEFVMVVNTPRCNKPNSQKYH